MGKEQFKQEIRDVIGTNHDLDFIIIYKELDVLADIVLSYYQKGFKDGQDATIKAFNEITSKPPFTARMSNPLSEIKD